MLRVRSAVVRHVHFDSQELHWIREHFRGNTRLVYKAVARRQSGEPLQHILGSQPFGPLDIRCNRKVLIPRPETEQWATRLLHYMPENAKVLDIGTGSGCIALLLAQKARSVWAVDISEDALNVARENATIHNIKNVTFIKGDYTDSALGSVIAEKHLVDPDILVANPPYILQDEYDRLDPSVSEYEPKIALLGTDKSVLDVFILAQYYKRSPSKPTGS
ncbi:hypothetical protein CANCADRAFT_42164 [Tortispora caseinolytica NRRL Y-17796]|uniref:Methyltransferase domain-containing protein n=1 Tax=Tortispora caseinolytica NRRL Y-17796 TaxID=767744 RepID=A0A1E4TIL2_9ASCO|nr:hypothetical protein CANCADRAFT_42164 [Tortispora caseinolytica NRRL Y-17796]